MPSRKQTAAARRNIKKAASAARSKRTISKLPKCVRTALGKEGAKGARRKRAGETDEDRAATIALAERITARGARVHSHAFMPLPGTPLAGAAPTAIAPDLEAAVSRLESKGAAYGQWRKQATVAGELVTLRGRRPRLPRA